VAVGAGAPVRLEAVEFAIEEGAEASRNGVTRLTVAHAVDGRRRLQGRIVDALRNTGSASQQQRGERQTASDE
jgi:hypothetical protein